MNKKKTDTKTKKQKEGKAKLAEIMPAKEAGKEATAIAECNDRNCPFHGRLRTRGRTFEGRVIRKFHKRITVEFERMIYIRKYERFARKKTKIHARLPECVEKQVSIGDLVQIRECRPLSKIIHFVFVKKIKDKEEK